MSELEEYQSQFLIGEKIIFNEAGENYIGYIESFTTDNLNEALYKIRSGTSWFSRYASAISKFNEQKAQNYSDGVLEAEAIKNTVQETMDKYINSTTELLKEIKEDYHGVTENGCEFYIFEDDEDDGIHIEISPDHKWQKEDVWNLIGELLYSVDELPEEATVVPEVFSFTDGELSISSISPDKKKENNILVLTNPLSLSKEQAEHVTEQAKQVLKKANIDATVLLLTDGFKAEFIKT